MPEFPEKYQTRLTKILFAIMKLTRTGCYTGKKL